MLLRRPFDPRRLPAVGGFVDVPPDDQPRDVQPTSIVLNSPRPLCPGNPLGMDPMMSLNLPSALESSRTTECPQIPLSHHLATPAGFHRPRTQGSWWPPSSSPAACLSGVAVSAEASRVKFTASELCVMIPESSWGHVTKDVMMHPEGKLPAMHQF